jgi:hypothetical protein
MAKVAGPLYSERAVGKFAGSHVYNTWRGMNIVKRLTSPAQPRTERQLLVRSYIQLLSQAWQALTSAQRADWQIWADANQPNDPQFGRPIPWTGYNAYVGLNCRMIDMGYAVSVVPPATTAPTAPTSLIAAFAAGDITVTWSGLGGTDKQFDLWYWINPSPARQPNIQLFKHYSYTAGEGGTLTITDATIGTWYFAARAVIESSGQISTFTRTQVTATA